MSEPLVVVVPPCAVDDFSSIVRALCAVWPDAMIGPVIRPEQGFRVYLRGGPPPVDSSARCGIHPLRGPNNEPADPDWEF